LPASPVLTRAGRRRGIGRNGDRPGNQPRARDAMSYPPRRDWWVSLLIVPTGLGLVAAGAFAAYQLATQAMPAVPGVVLATVLPLMGGLLLWAYFGTSYEITEAELVARVGLFRWRVPLAAIEEIVSTRGFRLVVGMGLAWSLDALHVKYRRAGGRMGFP